MIGRSSGVLLHVTSLPGGHGIGDLGPEAYRFADWLAAAGQQLWQVLPLGPTGYGDSPYASTSAFAGNPDLISLDLLRDEGLLMSGEAPTEQYPERINYEAVHAAKQRALRIAFDRFRPTAAYQDFLGQADYWLDDYVRVTSTTPDDEDFQRFTQFIFDVQWRSLRAHANQRRVHIIGDIPIFVADGSADVLANPDLFTLSEEGSASEVAGVPPDLFSETGQRWGNPHYRWDRMAGEGFRWWKDRLRRLLELVDVVRIDHFRGFAAYWSVPASHPTAETGEWKRGPGKELFDRAAEELGELPIVVEDLGLITSDVLELRDELGFPGMKVLQFAFDGKSNNPYLPHNYTPEALVYTGTHDNDTTLGWYQSLPEADKHTVRKYLGISGEDIVWDLIRLAMQSVANHALFPAQDILTLGSEARLNFPGTSEGNWGWRLSPGQLTPELAAGLYELTGTYGRLPRPEHPEVPERVKDYPFGVAGINSGL